LTIRFAGGPEPAEGFPVPTSAPAVSHLDAPATDRRALGQALAALRPRPVLTVGDLLDHTPFRHEDYRSERTLAEIGPGEEATIVCTIERVRVRPTRRRNLVIIEAAVRDESGPGVVIWFNQRYLAKQLRPGMRLSIRGERRPTIDAEIVAKSYERADDDSGGIHTAGLVPVYPASEKVSSRQIRALAGEVLRHAGDQVDPLPAATKARRRLPLRRDALTATHRPDTQDEATAGMSRLAFDELYLLQLGMLERRARFEETARAHPLPPPGELTARYLDALPFELTGAQARAVAAIDADVARDRPMRRLLQGDVGSGKTAVAAHALVRAVESGGQGALMAPTETLATQHLIGLTDLLAPLGVRVVALMQGTPAAERRAAVAEVGGGGPLVVVGTHALIQEQVAFGTLRVAVVDEQHRFGVEQRRALEEKSDGEFSPHVLHMTATPIPRTLALTVYGDLDVSVLDEMPPGRTRVVTRVLPLARRDEVFARMRRLLDEGRQAYVVCPLVSESESDREAAAAESEAARLRDAELRGYAVAHLHGQMPVSERRSVMDGFRRGSTQVLVATTVIEVGVDVANATLMVIEGADLFGLAQLHQLRGRVGRGAHESFCILLADPATDEARRRLDAMASTSDGFELAEVDLDLRGEGTVLAVKQSGIPELRHARLTRHRALAAAAREEAAEQLAADPGMTGPTAAVIAAATRRTFGDDVDWLAQA
jgi:ATP-dependent DNA helicase RecG